MKLLKLTTAASTVSLVIIAALLEGCVYALPAHDPPSQQKIRLVTNSPEKYQVRLVPDDSHSSLEGKTHSVAADGRVTVELPRMRRSCYVYFVGIPAGGGELPMSLRIVRGEKVVRKLSLDEISKLKTDSEGYHLLKIR